MQGSCIQKKAHHSCSYFRTIWFKIWKFENPNQQKPSFEVYGSNDKTIYMNLTLVFPCPKLPTSRIVVLQQIRLTN